MQKAMFFEEAFRKGILGKISSGYILSLRTPDFDKMDRQNDPVLIEMITYSGVKSIIDIGNGVKFQAQGEKMYCMLEPAAYTESHIEPAYRSDSTTGHMPFRFSDCETFLTKDSKHRILVPKEAHHAYDSFTVSFPAKGDMCILYFVFDKDIDGIVLPFIEENFQNLLQKAINLRTIDAKKVATSFLNVIKKFKMPNM